MPVLIPGQLYRFLEPLWVQLQLTWDQSSGSSTEVDGTGLIPDPMCESIAYGSVILDLGSVSEKY